jgi:nitrate/nitrite transporter NarK
MYVDKAVQTEDIKDACSSNKCWLYLTVVILIIQYGMCLGIEISVNTIMNLYFMYRFKKEGCVEGMKFVQNGTLFNTTINTEMTDDVNNKCSILDQDTASLIAALFGLTNLFARALGGIYSDILRKHLNIAGRLLAHFTCMAVEGIMLMIFSQMNTIPTAMAVMVAFGIFVQMSEGTTYSIVPYLAPRRMGVIAGLVGAGGNAGAFAWNTIWAQLVDKDPSRWFWILGIAVVCGSFLTAFAFVQQQRIWHVFTNSKLRTRKYKEEQNGEITKF